MTPRFMGFFLSFHSSSRFLTHLFILRPTLIQYPTHDFTLVVHYMSDVFDQIQQQCPYRAAIFTYKKKKSTKDSRDFLCHTALFLDLLQRPSAATIESLLRPVNGCTRS